MRPRSGRHRTPPLLLALGLLLAAVGAGGQGVAPEIPDVPAGDAAIRGRVAHLTRPDAAAGVEVVLYALSSAGSAGLRRGATDAAGRFAFEGIAADPAVAYLVGARFQGVPYPGARVRFDGAAREREVEVRIADVQADPSPVRVEELSLRLDPFGGSLQVSESLQLFNDGDRTVYVPEAARGDAPPAVELELPEGARGFQVPLGLAPEGLVRDGRSLRWFGPVYPGDQDLAYSYDLPAEGELTLRRGLGTRPERIAVLAPADGPRPRAAGLREAGEVEIEGRRYRRFDAALPGPGRAFELALDVPPASRDAARVSVAEARAILDPDPVALRAREEHVIRVEGDERVVAPLDRPLLRISLPEGAEALRFAADGVALGLMAHPEGGLALVGPLPPGESTVGVEYRLPAAGSAHDFERRFDHRVPLYSVYVRDAGGLELASDRLHRRRPVSAPGRIYAHLEAFEVEAGEAVGLTVGMLPPRASLSRPGLLAVFAGISLLVIAAIVAPLRGVRQERDDAAAPESASRREREAVYAALHDLEHDHETQKVDDEDYAVLRDELRSRAVALLRAEREQAAPAPAPAPDASGACPGCGRAPGPEDRFCAGCGARLESPPESEARA